MEYVVIDVREPYEFADGHVSGAINVPLTELTNDTDKLTDIPKTAKLIVYCRSGSRSSMAKNFLHKLGYTNVVNGINREQVEASYSL